MKSSKGIHIALWVAQGLLAVVFILSGVMKITSPIEEIAANGMTFVHHFSEGMVRFIGISEVLGSLGLILPSLSRIVPNIVLLAIAAFIAWGRMAKAPILTK